MCAKRITLYSASELKAKHPEGFDHALQHWQDHQDEIFWEYEIFESLWGLFKAAGVKAVDWTIGAYSYSWIKAEFNQDEAGELSGQRAVAWLENNLYGPLRIRSNHETTKKYGREPLKNFKLNASYRSCDDEHLKRFGHITRPYEIGKIPPAPFTGYIADDEYIDDLNKAIREGSTLREAFEGLADTARRLLEAEYDDQRTEEYFIDHAEANGYQFTRDGQRVYA